jgi:hypothetical protein
MIVVGQREGNGQGHDARAGAAPVPAPSSSSRPPAPLARCIPSTGGHASGVVRLWYNGQPMDSGASGMRAVASMPSAPARWRTTSCAVDSRSAPRREPPGSQSTSAWTRSSRARTAHSSLSAPGATAGSGGTGQRGLALDRPLARTRLDAGPPRRASKLAAPRRACPSSKNHRHQCHQKPLPT